MRAHVTIIALLLCTPCAAQSIAPIKSLLPAAKRVLAEARPVPRHSITPLQIVPMQTRITKNIMFVVDTSGSMGSEGRLGDALGAVSMIMEQPTDDMQIACLAFNDAVSRWPGYRTKGDVRLDAGWARMPSNVAIHKARAWLAAFQASGMTNVEQAIKTALEETKRDLTIVLVTDGDFPEDRLMRIARRWQTRRVEQKLGRAVIMVWGVGSEASKSQAAASLANFGGGGLWIDSKEKTGPW